MADIKVNIYTGADGSEVKHNATPVPLNGQAYDISDSYAAGSSVRIKAKYVIDGVEQANFSNAQDLNLSFTVAFSPSMVSETTVYWPMIYKTSDSKWSGITGITKDYFIIYSTDHATASDGGCYLGEFDSFTGDTLSGFVELGVLPIADGLQAETPFLMYVPPAESAYGTENIQFYMHTAQADTRNTNATQETHCYSFKGGSMLDINNWTYRGRPAPVETNETHSGYWRSWRVGANSYKGIHFTGLNSNYAVVTSTDGATWTRDSILSNDLNTPTGFKYRDDICVPFDYDNKKYYLAVIFDDVNSTDYQLALVTSDDTTSLPKDRIAILRSFPWPTGTGGNFPYQNFTYIEGDTAVILTKKGDNTNNTHPYDIYRYDLTPLRVDTSVEITSISENDTFTSLGDIELKAKVNGVISKVEFYEGANLIATVQRDTKPLAKNDEFTYVWNTAPEGNFSITAKAYTSVPDKLDAVSSPVNIIVNAPAFPSGLVAGYEFNGTNAADPVADVTGNHAGTNVNGVVGEAGVIGNSYNFVNQNDMVQIPNHADFEFSDGAGNDLPFTIITRVKWAANGNYTMIGKTKDANNLEWMLYAETGHLFMFKIFDKTWGNGIKVQLQYTKPLNEWVELSVTYDGSNSHDGLDLKINRQSVGTKSTDGTYTGMTNTGAMVRIAGYYSSVAGMKGHVDSTYIFKNKVLTDSEINYVLNNGYS
jgi:hypothetical protein